MSANPDLITNLNTVIIPAFNKVMVTLWNLVQATNPAAAAEMNTLVRELKKIFDSIEANNNDFSSNDLSRLRQKGAEEVNGKITEARAVIGGLLALPAGGIASPVAPLPQLPANPPQMPKPASEAGQPAEAVEVKAGGVGLAAARDDADDMVRMDEFFDSVSKSLLSAQRALNARSLDYVSELDPRFPPAYYGIPSVRAEMKVGFSQVRGKGINLILFSNIQQKMQYGESTVSFEVVGAPPPPGPAAFGNYVVPVPRFLAVGRERARIIRRVRRDLEKQLDKTVYANAEDEVVVLRYEREAGGEGLRPARYLVLWPARRKGETTEMWHTIAVVYAVERAGGDGKAVLDADGEALLDYPAKAESVAETDEALKRESIFEHPPAAGLLTLVPDSPGKAVTRAELDKLREAKDPRLVDLVINLGDVLMNVSLIFNQWLRAVEYKPNGQAPPADE